MGAGIGEERKSAFSFSAPGLPIVRLGSPLEPAHLPQCSGLPAAEPGTAVYLALPRTVRAVFVVVSSYSAHLTVLGCRQAGVQEANFRVWPPFLLLLQESIPPDSR